MALVASLYHLPPRVLPAIQEVEGGRPGVIHQNTDGTLDLGVMQINTRWLVPLSHYTHAAVPVVFRRLRDEPCYSIAAAGAIMRNYLDETKGDLLRAVGDYHSHTIELNLAYRGQVVQAARDLFVSSGGHAGMTRPMRRAIRRRYQGRGFNKAAVGWERVRSQPG